MALPRRAEEALLLAGVAAAPAAALPGLFGLLGNEPAAKLRVELLYALLRREDPPIPQLIWLVSGLGAAEERALVRDYPALPERLVEHLASSRRIRTLRELASRDTLSPLAIERIYARAWRRQDWELVRRVLKQPRTPAALRLQATAEQRGHLTSWVLTDPVVSEQVLIGRLLAALSGRPPYMEALKYLVGALPPWAHPFLRDEIARATPEQLRWWVHTTGCGSPAFAVALPVIVERGDGQGLLDVTEAASAPLDFPRNIGRLGQRRRWRHDLTVDVVADCGVPELRRLALASEALDPARRRAACSGDDAEVLAVALNRSLEPAEIDLLLDRLPGEERWRLFYAKHLSAPQRLVVIRSKAAVAHLHACLRDQRYGEVAERWLTNEIAHAVLPEREELVADAVYGELAHAFLERHPGLASLVLAHLWATDTLTPELAHLVIDSMFHPVEGGEMADPAAVDLLVGLLKSWEGGIGDLLAIGTTLVPVAELPATT